MAIIAAIIAGGLGVAGSAIGAGGKPSLPKYAAVDPYAEQRNTISSNAAALPQAAGLASNVNFANQQNLNKLLESQIPGYRANLNQASQNFGSYLKGEIPKEVQDQIMRVGAEKSTGLGYGGSGASRNLVARDLGMTSLDLAKAATSALPGFVSGVRASSVATPFDPTSMFLTPIEAANLKKQGVDTQFQRDVYQSQINAAPDPALAALGKTLSGFGGVAASYGLNSSLASRYGVQSPKQYPGGSQWPLM